MNASVIQSMSPTRRLSVTTWVTSLAFFMVQLDGSILNVGLAQIGVSLHTGVDGLQWTVDIYFLTFAVLLLSAGLLSDRLGARRAYIIGLGVFSAASLACALSFNIAMLIVARGLQGIGAAMLVPCSLALLNSACGSDEAARARAIGFWTAAGGLALAAGPTIGGLLVGTFGWWSIFLINVPIGLIGIRITVRFVDPVPAAPSSGHVDFAGQILAALSLLGLVGTIIQAGELGWGAPVVSGGLVLAAVTGIAFIAVEHRSRNPMLPLSLFANSTFSGAAAVGFVVNLTIFGLGFALGLYFQRVLGWSALDTGLAFLPWALMVTAANLVGSRLASSFGPRVPIIGGLFIAAAGFAWLQSINVTTTYLAMLPAQFAIRIGIGLTVPPMTAALLSTVDRSQSGIGSGALNAVRQTGGAVGVGLFGALMIGSPVHGFQIALIVSSVVLLLGAGVAIVTIRSAAKCPVDKNGGRRSGRLESARAMFRPRHGT